jgi:hypothetical protein
MHDNTSPQAMSNFTESGESPKRKLCVRHQRMADEGANVAMQQVSLHHILIIFRHLTHPQLDA